MLVFGRRLAASILALVLTGAFCATAQERPLDVKLQTAFDQGQLSGLHNVLVVRDGKVLAERHFAGIDLPMLWKVEQAQARPRNPARSALGYQIHRRPSLRHCLGRGQSAWH